MTTLEKIMATLSEMDEQQLETISEMIEALKAQKRSVPTLECDRSNILTFIHHARSHLPTRTPQDIDHQIREERNSWDS